MSGKKYLIVYVGFNGFPEGYAPGERQRLISRSLVELDNRVIILSRKGTNNRDYIKLPFHGIKDGMEYIFTSGSAYRPKSFIKRNILKIIGVIGELFFLVYLRLHHRINYLIFYSRDIRLLKYYSLLSKILHYKIIIDYTELASSFEEKKIFFKKFETKSPFYTNGAFCISSYLLNTVQKLNPALPLIKVPIICDIGGIEKIAARPKQTDYFLYCGTLHYIDIIEFILKSFEKAATGITELYLIVSGNDKNKEKLNLLINKSQKNKLIKVFSDLNYNDLIGYYKSALALLIPLRSTVQDISRFPHKIGEYSASGRPVISMKYGEIAIYFTDMGNALLADDYSLEKFRKMMEFVINNQAKATEIGLNGKLVASSFFDYRAIGPQIIKLFDKLSTNNR